MIWDASVDRPVHSTKFRTWGCKLMVRYIEISFGMVTKSKDFICDRDRLFGYLDDLASQGLYFNALTYVVNQWSLGGVVRLKHHGCILAEVSGGRFLKFDFGRWGVGWTLSDTYPEHPKGTFHVETYEIDGDPLRVKHYLVGVEPFSWMGNNCSTFSKGIIQELRPTEIDNGFDPWPTWSHCVANPPVKVPPVLPSCTPWLTDAIDPTGARERLVSVGEVIVVDTEELPEVPDECAHVVRDNMVRTVTISV